MIAKTFNQTKNEAIEVCRISWSFRKKIVMSLRFAQKGKDHFTLFMQHFKKIAPTTNNPIPIVKNNQYILLPVWQVLFGYKSLLN